MTESDIRREGQPLRVSKRSAAISNYFFGMAQVAFITINGIILVPLYLSHMSLSLYGAWLASGNVIAILATLDSGIGVVLTQRLAGALGRNDLKNYSVLALSGCVWISLIGVFAGGLGMALSIHVPAWFHIAGPESAQLTRAVVLAAAAAGIGMVSQTVGALPQACQRTVGMGLAALGSTVVGIGATVAALLSGSGVASLGLGLLAKSGTQLIGYLILVVHHWRVMRVPVPRWSYAVTKSLIGQAAPLFLARASSVFAANSETAISAALISPAAAAVLSITWRVASVIRMTVERIGSAVFAGVSWIHGSGDVARTAAIIGKILRLSNFILGVGVGGVIAFNRPIVTLWVGPDKFGGDVLNILIAAAVAVAVTISLMSYLLQAIGNFKVAAFAEVSEVFVRLGLMLALGRIWGVSGLVLGGLLANLLTKAWLVPRFLAKALGLARGRILGLLTSGAKAGLICIAIGLAWKFFFLVPQKWTALFVQAGAYGSVVILILLFDARFRKLTLGYLQLRFRSSQS